MEIWVGPFTKYKTEEIGLGLEIIAFFEFLSIKFEFVFYVDFSLYFGTVAGKATYIGYSKSLYFAA